MALRHGSIPLALVLVAGCGGAAKTPPHPPAPADGAIPQAVLHSHPSTAPAVCTRVFPPSFIDAAFQGVPGCQTHLKDLAKLPPRTIRVISIRRDGPVADARIRVDSFDQTVKLVLSGRQWQVDDTVGDSGSAKTNLAQSRAGALAQKATNAPVALRRAVAFAPIGGIGPDVHFGAAVVRVDRTGFTRTGARTGRGPVANQFGAVKRRSVLFHVVNVRVRLTNRGPKPFRGTLSGFVYANGKRPWPAMRHVGRRPDWTDGEQRGIAPGRSATRWVSFALPVSSGAPRIVELEPELLAGRDTVMI